MQLTINGKPRDFDQATLSVADLVTTLNLAGKRLAIEAGREAYLAGRMPKKLYSASPISPTTGLIS